MKQFIFIALLFFIFNICEVFAQTNIRGKVLNDKSLPISEVKVSVDGSDYASSNIDGIFNLTSPNPPSEKPRVVKANKTGLVMKDWRYRAGEVEIIMTEPVRVQGRVISSRKKLPLAGVRVMIIGVRGLDAVKTNENGYFIFDIPKNIVIQDAGLFQIFDPGRLKSIADYQVKMGEDGLVYLEVDVPPRTVKKVKVSNKDNQSIKGTTVLIDNIPYTSNENGEFSTPESVNDFSNYRIDNQIITKYDYLETGSVMNLIVRQPIQGENPNQPTAITLEERKESVLAEKAFIDFQNKKVIADINAIEARLRSGENISAAERQNLEERLKQLKETLEQNQRALDIVTEKAEDVISEISKEFAIQKQITQDTKSKLEATELKSKLANEQANRNIIIFVLVATSLLVIVLLFYFNNQKINKQKRQLADSVNEINQKNLLLEESARVMDLKNKQINEKNEQLVSQTKELEFKNAKITDSIRYARTIQQSILPSNQQIAEIVKDNFIFFEPKDIVSGDFYWLSKKGEEILIAIGDCTGHGVPGGFMTMLGSTLLNQIVNENSITNPAVVLTELNEYIVSMIHHKADDLREGDGMDIGFLNLNLATKEAIFSGAKLPLYYVRNQELTEIKPSNLSIGTSLSKKGKVYENQSFKIQEDDIFYLSSDGFHDQLGGVNLQQQTIRRKYMRSRMVELILANHHRPFAEQQKIFQEEFINWKGKNDQTDDVIIFGFKV